MRRIEENPETARLWRQIPRPKKDWNLERRPNKVSAQRDRIAGGETGSLHQTETAQAKA